MKRIKRRGNKILLRVRFTQLFACSLLTVTSSIFAGNTSTTPSLIAQKAPSRAYTCIFNLGFDAKLKIPNELTTCAENSKEIVRSNIGFFIRYPDMRLRAEVERVPDTRDLFQIDVVSLYQNPKNDSEWGGWPSTFVQNTIVEVGPITRFPTIYHKLYKIIGATALKEYPHQDTSHAPGEFITDAHSENQIFAQCGLPTDQCTVSVYNTTNHFEYEMYYPAYEVDKTMDIVNAISKMIKSWQLHK